MEDTLLSPVAGFTSAPISALNAVMLQIQYLTHAGQEISQAHQTPNFALTATQAQELIQQIGRALARLDTGPQEGAGLPKH